MSERPPISPRSPRAALEPEQVPPPPKRSERARNPFVVVGNAVITFVLVLMIGVGGVYIYGRQKIEAPGPLQTDKIVNIPARAGMTDIADNDERIAGALRPLWRRRHLLRLQRGARAAWRNGRPLTHRCNLILSIQSRPREIPENSR